MASKVKSGSLKLGPFSHDEIKALLMTIGVGVVLGFAVEMVDRALPKDHQMKAIVKKLTEGRKPRKEIRNSSYDMEKPKVRFDVIE